MRAKRVPVENQYNLGTESLLEPSDASRERERHFE